MHFWMFASPVAYPSTLVPVKWRWLYGLNPMAGVIDGFRWANHRPRPASQPSSSRFQLRRRPRPFSAASFSSIAWSPPLPTASDLSMAPARHPIRRPAPPPSRRPPPGSLAPCSIPFFAWAGLRPPNRATHAGEHQAMERFARGCGASWRSGWPRGASAVALRTDMDTGGTLYLVDPFHLSRVPMLNFPAAGGLGGRVSRKAGAQAVWIEEFSHGSGSPMEPPHRFPIDRWRPPTRAPWNRIGRIGARMLRKRA